MICYRPIVIVYYGALRYSVPIGAYILKKMTLSMLEKTKREIHFFINNIKRNHFS